LKEKEEQNSKLIKMPSAAYLKTESYAKVDKNSEFTLDRHHAPTLDLTSIMPSCAQPLRFGSFEAKVEDSPVIMLNEFTSTSLSLSHPLVSVLPQENGKRENENDLVINVAEMTEDKRGLNLHGNFESAADLYAENQREFLKTAVKELSLDVNVISEHMAIKNSVRSLCDTNKRRHQNEIKEEIPAGTYIYFIASTDISQYYSLMLKTLQL